MKILLTCKLADAAMERLTHRPDIEVDAREIKDEAVLADAVSGCDALVVRSNVKVTAEVFDAADRLKVVGRAGIGVDNIDMAAATRRGVAVVNAPSGNTVTTAEHAIAMMMSLARRIPQASASMKAGQWEKKKFMGAEVRGKTLGVIGVGRIGATVAELALGLKMRVIAYDPFLGEARAAELGVERVELDELLARADVITLHTPLTPETRRLINAERLARVKPGVYLLNCARGPIVDPDALAAAIEAGRVAGAALDVFDQEPPPAHPLFERPEVVLTPHLGASTVEAQEGVAVEIIDNVLAYLDTGVAPNTLNLPSVPLETFHRLRPHLELAEQLGRFGAQVADGPITEARLQCRGRAAEDGVELLTAAFLAGALGSSMEGVNIVNARSMTEQRGIRVVSSITTAMEDFTELVSVEVGGDWGKHVLDGTLFGKVEPRLVRYDGFRIDARPRGTLILIYNNDVPGVIGAVGNCLGRNNVNIAGLYNGREAVGGRAVTLVDVDSAPAEGVLDELRTLPEVLSVKPIVL